jgi:serine/threonine-protein kinase
LKPENIFICKREDGTDLVKLLDFGIARSLNDGRLTGQGELFGTPQYMSPGRIKGNDTTRADDLYAIGVLFFEMLTGQLPFDAPDVATFFIKHLTEKPKPPVKLNPLVPQALNDLILRLLAKDEKGRPVDAHSVEADLLRISSERALSLPRSAESDAEVPPPPATLREGAGEVWTERLRLAELVLTRAFGEPALAPTDVVGRLRALQEHNVTLERLRSETLNAERELSQIEQRGREARQRIGFAVDALGQDASKARAELRDAEEGAERLASEEPPFAERFKVAHTDMMRLEGRFAFQNPIKALSDAYRRAADLLDAWREMQTRIGAATEVVSQKARAASDLDFQINQLRSALVAQEEKSEGERNTAAAELEAREKAASRVEVEMVEQLRGLVAMLRARPDVASLVLELDRSIDPPKAPAAPRTIEGPLASA